jgi:hypothetical protein
MNSIHNYMDYSYDSCMTEVSDSAILERIYLTVFGSLLLAKSPVSSLKLPLTVVSTSK